MTLKRLRYESLRSSQTLSMAPRVVVCGMGVAGLTAARILSRRTADAHAASPPRMRLTLIDTKHKTNHTRNNHDRGLGLWPRAVGVLRSLPDLNDHLDKALAIPPAAYRSRHGEWLSMSAPHSPTRVVTMRQSDLTAALEAGLPPDASIRRGCSLVAVDQRANDGSLVAHLDDGTSLEADVLIGADGALSKTRQLAVGDAGSTVAPTGYVCHSGILAPAVATSLPHREPASGPGGDSPPAPPYAFETLSRGHRFALVPLADGGAFWFATRPASKVRSLGTSPAALVELRAAYAGWHQPVPRALHAAACAHVESVMGDGPSSMRHEALHAVAAHARWSKGGVVLVGDAAHALPHNLAQGASCAIEGAHALAERLDAWAGGSASLADALDDYRAVHEPRVARCRAMTAFTALLASPTSAWAEGLRNAMRMVPQPLNHLVFDCALAASLGDWPTRVGGGRSVR